MFRASSSLLRAIPRASSLSSRICPIARPRANLPTPRWNVPIARFANSSQKLDASRSKGSAGGSRDKDDADDFMKPRPDEVSNSSSVRRIIEHSPRGSPPPEVNEGLKHDLDVVKDTFRLSKVPRESHILGLAGTLPYLATSLSTVFLAWDLTKELPTGSAIYDAVFVDHETAQHLLNVIEPLQLGYGAVIISFLGAIHWGLEYAEKTPERKRTRFRYGVGVAASVIAWPTVLMPIEYALTTQFMAFVALYFIDSRAAVRGWAPHWYGMYRFLLTAMVGLAILVSLVGRAKIKMHGSLTKSHLSSSLSNPGIADRETDWAKLEAQEKDRAHKKEEKMKRQAAKDAAQKDLVEKKADGGSKKPKAGGSKDKGGNKDKEEKEGGGGDKEEGGGEKEETRVVMGESKP